MAYWISERGPNSKSFVCDYVSDVAKLPTNKALGASQEDRHDNDFIRQMTSEGSDVIVLEDASVYMLNSEGVWKKL